MKSKFKKSLRTYKVVVFRALRIKIQMTLIVKSTKRVRTPHQDTNECPHGKENTMSPIMMVSTDFKINSVLKYLT